MQRLVFMVCAESTFGRPMRRALSRAYGRTDRSQNRGENGLQDDSSRESMDAASGAPGGRSASAAGRGETGVGAGACSTARIHRRRCEAIPPSGGVDSPRGGVVQRKRMDFRRITGSAAFGFMPA